MNINTILSGAVAVGASDIHIVAGMRPVIRVNTELFEMDNTPEIDPIIARRLLTEMLDEDKITTLEENRDIDFSTKVNDGTRFRVNVHFERGSLCMAFRIISSKIPSIDQLGLPAKIKELTKLTRGLILVTGPTGSGKSTTLAAMIDEINTTSNDRIITLEDPIEYALSNKQSVITQREIGIDCKSFASGLRHALRQDPDVILVGEMRDLETAGSTITAAETGHLVFSTLHTMSAAQTVERIIDIYPPSQQGQIRSMLSNSLQAVISQTLFKRIDTRGMFACTELMLCTPAVRNCIRENRICELHNTLETGRGNGMHTMDQSIAEACIAGIIDPEEATVRASNPARLQKMLQSHVKVGA